MATTSEKTFTHRLVGAGPEALLELMNGSDQTPKSIEILTVFLKDLQTAGGGPSQAHIRFEGLKSIQPNEKAVVSHRTWINGKPVPPSNEQLERLRVIAGEACPYVLDISWQDAYGKTQFQRIPVGH